MSTKRKITTEKKSKPFVLDFYEFNEEHEQYLSGVKLYDGFKLKCKTCNKEIKASIFTTSNWVTHLQTKHEPIYAEYEKNRKKGVSVIYI